MDEKTVNDIRRLLKRDLKDTALYLAYYVREGHSDAAAAIEFALKEYKHQRVYGVHVREDASSDKADG